MFVVKSVDIQTNDQFIHLSIVGWFYVCMSNFE